MLVKEQLKTRKKNVITITPEAGIIEAMDVLISNEISCLPVSGKSGELVGIVSDKDIFKAIFEHQDGFSGIKVRELMATNLIIGVPDDEIDYIAGLMTKNYIRHVPIMDQQKLVGLISSGDVVKCQQKRMEIENRYLKMYMEGTHLG